MVVRRKLEVGGEGGTNSECGKWLDQRAMGGRATEMQISKGVLCLLGLGKKMTIP